jgi:hypothetical protein
MSQNIHRQVLYARTNWCTPSPQTGQVFAQVCTNGNFVLCNTLRLSHKSLVYE